VNSFDYIDRVPDILTIKNYFMKKVLFVLAVSLIALTSFAPEKKETANESATCVVTVYEVTRYFCGDVVNYVYNTTGPCNTTVIIEITNDRSEEPCTHDHSAPPDGLN
jgi:hypothetical protein